MSLMPVLLKPLKPSQRCSISRCEPGAPFMRNVSALVGSRRPSLTSVSNRSDDTDHVSGAVNACHKTSMSVNGFMTRPPSWIKASRTAVHRNSASRWCIPASPIAPPCSPHHRPMVPRDSDGGNAVMPKSVLSSSAVMSTSAKITTRLTGCSRIWAPQPASAPA